MANYRPLIVNTSAQQIQELTDADNLVISNSTLTAESFVGNGTIPVGGIILWSGTIANIPTGWALCNGQNDTPDLRNKFIVGAHSGTNSGISTNPGPGFSTSTGLITSNYEPGDVGGESAHRLTVAELAHHSHSGGMGGGNCDPGGQSQSAPQATGKTGDDHAHENRPPYYALAYIMRTA